jgi:branched-chain amino acid transport system ATP-binding protein
MIAILELTGVTRRFGGLIAVGDVTMSVAGGEIRGLIGPNGAGKTTLLNVIGGQLRPSSGRVTIAGRDITGLRPDQRAALGIRRTFQNLKLFGEMTVLENVMVGFHAHTRAEIVESLLRLSGQRREEATMIEESLRALSIVGLVDQAYQPAASMSHGHRRLLEIARAIVSRPRLLLLDEPAAGMNMSEAAELVRLIRQIQTTDIAIILVEHHMDVVMTVCQTISVLNYGQLLAEGTPEHIRDHPDVRDAYLGRSDFDVRMVAHA